MGLRRILIANRGEIAVRIIRACSELGVESVAVYSDADARSPHVTAADRSIRIGPPPPAASYLNIDAILKAAQESGADAIHPGYGFLSENARFAETCAAQGVTFIGPAAAVIRQLGSKIAARALAERVGVPVVAGAVPSDQTDAGLITAAERFGYPILVKPSEGGGGIGMKAVSDPATLPSAISQARREAVAAFGDGTLYFERLLTNPRHIEFQILGDSRGNVIHLFERECSLQRRHQKVIEETPSSALTDELRRRMGEAAVSVARAAGYVNAGTIEFMLEGNGSDARFYFLEMNTRLQVEHPITEQVVGVDLVRAQIAIASGEPLPWKQRDLAQRGHAIEARVYAEDPARDHLPQAGRLLLYREPELPGVRVDSGVTEGSDVSVHYDPMLAKLIAHGETREAARRRAIDALSRYPILGIRTNVAYLIALLEHPRFVAGDTNIAFLQQEAEMLRAATSRDVPDEAMEVARAAPAFWTSHEAPANAPDPWSTLRGYRG